MMKTKYILVTLIALFIATSTMAQRKKKTTSKGKAMLMSTVLPGWGAAKLNQQNSLLVIGGFFYASLGGAYYYHNKAVTDYDKYLVADNLYDRTEYSKDWDTDLRLSKIFLFSAAAIWAADMFWVATMRTGNSFTGYKRQHRHRMFSYYNPAYRAPMIGVSIKF